MLESTSNFRLLQTTFNPMNGHYHSRPQPQAAAQGRLEEKTRRRRIPIRIRIGGLCIDVARAFISRIHFACT